MEAFELILLLMVAVLLSSVLDQVVPRISSPLIQIGLGVIIAFLAISPIQVSIDPELFLILFIAPLLFHDSIEANKKNLWDNKGIIVSYAIGLVLLIVLCVGFVLHWLVPSIPLAAAKLFLKAKEGKHIHDQAIHFAQAKRIQLSFAHPLPAQIDGERFYDNEVSVQVFPSEIEVLMP